MTFYNNETSSFVQCNVEICVKYNLHKLLCIQAHSLMSGSETLIVMKWTYEARYCNVSVVMLAVKDQGDMLDGIHKMMDDEVKVKRVRQHTCVCLPVSTSAYLSVSLLA